MNLADERQLMKIARSAVGAYLARHPGVAHQADDLLSDACFGAASAAGRHDAEGGASRANFAFRRAQGAIIDGIRHRSPLGRTEYARAEDPSALAAKRTPLPLELLMEATAWQPSHAHDGLAEIERAEEVGAARDEVARLLSVCSPLERMALLTVVASEQPAVAVAERLGVTESAVSQAKARGLERIRAFLADPSSASRAVERDNHRTFQELLASIPEIATLSKGVTVDTTKEKIAAALRHESTAIRRAAQRANEDLAKLDGLLAEWDTKEAARAKVAELEQALADARAALRGGVAKKTAKASGEHSQARAWANANGVPCPPKGRVPLAVIDGWRRSTVRAA